VPRARHLRYRHLLVLALLSSAILAFAYQSLSYRYLSDDAFISFRYAQNWAKGSGPVYNTGDRVEGYTNFLWMAILTGLYRLGADIVLSARGLGFGLGVAIILLTYRFSLRWHSACSFWTVLAPGLLALNLSFAVWAIAGLETHLFTFLVLLAAFLHLDELREPSRFPWSAVALAMCVMTRPDGLVFVGLTGLHRLWIHRGRISRQDVLWGLAFCLLYVPYYVWRLWYYGYPFPNTFYAKVGGGAERLSRGIDYVKGFVVEYGGGPIAVLAVFLVILGRLDRDSKYLALLMGGYAIYVTWVGGDALIEYRFLIVVTPMLYLLIQQSLWRIQQWISESMRERGINPKLAVWAFVTAAVVILVYLLVAQPRVQTSRDRVVRTRVRYDALAMIGQWLRGEVPEEASLAVNVAGAVPFYSELTTIDMLGLNDVHIAHRTMPDMGEGLAGHEKHDAEYVLSKRPTFIAPLPLVKRPLNSEDWHAYDSSVWFPGIGELLNSAELRSLYVPRSLNFRQYGLTYGKKVLGLGRFYNFFQLRDASLARTQEAMWDFGEKGGMMGWKPGAGVEVRGVSEAAVSLAATSADPSITISGLHWWATPCDELSVRMRLTSGTMAQVFWLNRLAPEGSEFQSLAFSVEPDGGLHTYEFFVGESLSWAGRMSGLRLDFSDEPSEIEIDYIRLGRACETLALK
jgi:hypothetical protein